MRLAPFTLAAAAIVSLSILSDAGTAEAGHRHRYYHHHHGGFHGGAAVFGFASGLLLGGAIASPYGYYGAPYYHPRPYYYPRPDYYPPPVVYGGPVGYYGYRHRPYYGPYQLERGYIDSLGD
jgi:hypothetical protein